MRRYAFFLMLLAAPIALLASGRTRAVRQPPEVAGTVFGAPAGNLTPRQLATFIAGVNEFLLRRSASDGLGPVFNGFNCLQCHSRGGPGGGSGNQVLHVGRTVNGVFDPMTQFGGSVMQSSALGPNDVPNHPFHPDRIPAGATIITGRDSPPLFGLGLVEATTDETFLALARAQAIVDPSIAGRAAIVANFSTNTKTVGKFGWKAQVPTLFQFAGDALLNEMGITSPQFPDENCPSGDCSELAFNPMPGLNDNGGAVRRLTDFMLMLGPPPRGAITPDVLEGERVFAQIGCASCHTPSLTTGSSEVLALDHKTYHPYSDFLLHDMGSLSDGIEQESATGSEFRTAPLWGIRAIHGLLHDGRAGSVDEAIVAHDGQSRPARDRYLALDEQTRAKLRAFVMSL